jgi:thiosulfate dehydrogenase (quinone) large subunit
MFRDYRSLAYFLLRITFGMIFLVFGIQKLAMGPSTFAGAISGEFAKSPLPAPIAYAFGLVLPFLETALGLAITLGIFTVPALAASALLLLILAFGLAVSGQGQMLPTHLIYALVNFVLLFAVEHDRYSLDTRRNTK